MHYRKSVRDKVKLLLEGKLFYATKVVPVFQSRSMPWWTIELPAVSFYTLNEEADDERTAPRFYNRDFQLLVNIVVAETAGTVTDDVIDEIAEQIENILEQDPTLSQLVNDLYMRSTSISIKEEGEKLFSAATILFTINTKTPAPGELPEGALEEFETAHASIELNGISINAISATAQLQE